MSGPKVRQRLFHNIIDKIKEEKENKPRNLGEASNGIQEHYLDRRVRKWVDQRSFHITGRLKSRIFVLCFDKTSEIFELLLFNSNLSFPDLLFANPPPPKKKKIFIRWSYSFGLGECSPVAVFVLFPAKQAREAHFAELANKLTTSLEIEDFLTQLLQCLSNSVPKGTG